MPLGADHVEAPGLFYFLVFSLDSILGVLESLRPSGLVLFRVFSRIETRVGEILHGQELGIATQHDVSTTPGHISSYRNGTLASRHRHDRGLALMLLRVEHFMWDPTLAQHLGKEFTLFDAGSTHQHRLPLSVALDNVNDDGLKLGLFMLEN